MNLTIGTAAYDDFDGVYFTLQAIKMYFPQYWRDIELVVIDNQPNTPGSGYIKNLLENWSKQFANTQYVPMESPKGTTQPRNKVFEVANGDIVMCVDSHVLLSPGSITALNRYFKERPNSGNIVSGPMLYDDLLTPNTHFDNFWRSQMWGIWGNAWRCSEDCGFLFTPHQNLDGTAPGQTDYYTLDMSFVKVKACPVCGKVLPQVPYGPHVPALIKSDCLETTHFGKPFEIPGMGLGLFACRREAWLGFNPHFRGFGGEELYIHEKYRRAGHRAVCIPQLRWGHRFGRPNGVPYKGILTLWNKVRNYVLGAQEIGLPLGPIAQHFNVGKPGGFPQWEWDQLIADPINLPDGPNKPAAACSSPKESVPAMPQSSQPRATIADVGELIAWIKTQPRDLDKHVDKISELAAQHAHVTEITHRRESTVALLTAREKVVSYQAERDTLVTRLLDLFPLKLDVKYVEQGFIPPAIESTELLFIDPVGTYTHLNKLLDTLHSFVSGRIIVHDTDLYYATGADGQMNPPNKRTPGLMMALRDFMKAHPEWSIVYHTKEQHGLTVLSRLVEDKPKLPSTIQMATNFSKAMVEFASDGFRTVTKEVYEERANVCTVCPHRVDNRCSICGCGLAKKLQIASSYCPLSYWDAVVPTTPAPEVQ